MLRLLALHAKDHDIVVADRRLARVPDRRDMQPLVPGRGDEAHALGTQRVEMDPAGDQQDVMPDEEQTRPDGAASTG